MDMERINGYTVVAEFKFSGGTRDILAVKPYEHSPSGFEYVVAGMDVRTGREWHNGRYFLNIADAVRHFESR